MLDAIDRINRELGTTTAIITHNAAIGAMADRVVRFADGARSGWCANARRGARREVDW